VLLEDGAVEEGEEEVVGAVGEEAVAVVVAVAEEGVTLAVGHPSLPILQANRTPIWIC
jgi:hypothetical protein